MLKPGRLLRWAVRGGRGVARCRSREGLDDGLGEGLGRLRVLAGHKLPPSATTTCDVHGSPLLYLPPLPVRPCSFEPREGLDGLRLSHLVLFDIREARHLEAGDERRAVGLLALDEPDGTVADRADDLAGGVGPFDDRLQRRRRGPVEVDAPV